MIYLKCLQIPTKYMLEMIADWRGAGRAITGKDNLSEWFTANKSNIKSRMSIQTYESVCKLIGENK